MNYKVKSLTWVVIAFVVPLLLPLRIAAQERPYFDGSVSIFGNPPVLAKNGMKIEFSKDNGGSRVTQTGESGTYILREIPNDWAAADTIRIDASPFEVMFPRQSAFGTAVLQKGETKVPITLCKNADTTCLLIIEHCKAAIASSAYHLYREDSDQEAFISPRLLQNGRIELAKFEIPSRPALKVASGRQTSSQIDWDPDAVRQQAISNLAKKWDIKLETLTSRLDEVAEEILASKTSTPWDRVLAHLQEGEYEDALDQIHSSEVPSSDIGTEDTVEAFLRAAMGDYSGAEQATLRAMSTRSNDLVLSRNLRFIQRGEGYQSIDPMSQSCSESGDIGQNIVHSSEIPTISGAPFSASEKTLLTKMLSSGELACHSLTISTGRDSHGRVRREFRHMVTASSDPHGELETFTIYEPSINRATECRPSKGTCAKRALAPIADPYPLKVPDQNAKGIRILNLGTRKEQGLELIGQLEVFDQGGDGELKDLSEREIWYSPQLHVNVTEIRRSRSGLQATFQLLDIVQSEPASDLFMILPNSSN